MPIDPEEARRHQEKRNQQKQQDRSERANFYSLPREGHAKVRHLPHWDDPTKIPGRIVWTHWNIPEIGRCFCFKTWNMDCRVCLAISKFSGLIKTQDWESRGRSYTNALILEDTGNPMGVNPVTPRILGINGYTDFDLDWIVGLVLNPDFGDVTDPFNGRDIIYRRKKKDGAWDKQVIPRSRPIAETPEKIQEILSKASNLDLIFPKEPRDEDFQNIVKASEFLIKTLEEKLSLMKRGLAYQVPSQKTYTPKTETPTYVPTGTKCSICGNPQFSTPSGITCAMGHGVTPASVPPASVPPASVAPPATPAVSKKGVPECFGNHDDTQKKCIVCSKSFECEDTAKKK